MAIKQISVFIENKRGALGEITDIIAREGVDLLAVSLADTAEFGIFRTIVSDTEKAKAALCANNFLTKLNTVIGIRVSNVPGGLAKAIKLLSDNGMDIEYLYDFVDVKENKATVVLRLDDIENAEKLLRENGFELM